MGQAAADLDGGEGGSDPGHPSAGEQDRVPGAPCSLPREDAWGDDLPRGARALAAPAHPDATDGSVPRALGLPPGRRGRGKRGGEDTPERRGRDGRGSGWGTLERGRDVRQEQIVEAVLFASDAPLSAEEIARADEVLDEDAVGEAIRTLRVQYQEQERAFELVEVAEGYQILTKPEFAPYLERFDTVPRSSRLSGPSLETLAIIAYRQPIDRLEIEYIRGVGAVGVIRTLQDRGLIEAVGRGEGIGRPLLYGTTRRFLEHFGFASLEGLPRPEDLPIVLRDRAAPIQREAAPSIDDGLGDDLFALDTGGSNGQPAGEPSVEEDELNE
ncbi:MAG: SMC-Scp complex subunit ScpB [Gemmatimonadetes bacterium]|nr:SMC-Scp complex subunit ScpB [Gemmatimonadota bacterium]